MKSNRYDISLIRRYLDGELDPRAMYELERQAQSDPLLMDLILGMESGDKKQHQTNLIEINDRIKARTVKSDTRKLWPVLTAAASIILAACIAMFFVLKPKLSPQLVKQKPVAPAGIPAPDLIPADSIKPARDQTVAVRKKTKKDRKELETFPAETNPEPLSDITLAANDKPAPASGILNEVVVVGYGTQKKVGLSSSVNRLKIENTKDTASHAPVAETSGLIRIRGLNSGNQLSSSITLVKGFVTDDRNKQPIPGVSVRIKGSQFSTITNSEGKFEIPVLNKTAELQFNSVGYASEEVKVRSEDSLLNIALKPSLNALNEIVVVGYGRNVVEDPEKVHPLIGWDKYRKYLKDNAIADKSKGTVTVKFTVLASGRPGNIKVINGLDEETNARAIGLIRSGSAWVGGKNGQTKEVKLKIRFR